MIVCYNYCMEDNYMSNEKEVLEQLLAQYSKSMQKRLKVQKFKSSTLKMIQFLYSEFEDDIINKYKNKIIPVGKFNFKLCRTTLERNNCYYASWRMHMTNNKERYNIYVGLTPFFAKEKTIKWLKEKGIDYSND